MATTPPLRVVFLNENTLGHSSYLPRFVRELEARPDLGITPIALNVIPMPAALQRRADHSIRGLRKFGLDFHAARWRRIVSRHARGMMDDLRRRQPIDAIVLNTQSVGLNLTELAREVPLLVCLDATFCQLRRSRWFAMNRVAAWFTPLTLAPILPAERRLLAAARRLLPWSAPVRESLLAEYQIPAAQVEVLPPSLDLGRFRPSPAKSSSRPQVLFVGGDFFRKGGRMLLDAYRGGLANRCDLHLITESNVAPEPGIHVHHLTAGSDGWLERWQQADVFVFPSLLETFGIVLVEALAFGVPTIASRAGAATDILDGGEGGVLLSTVSPATIAAAIHATLDDLETARRRAAHGRRRVERDFDLRENTARLARMVHSSVTGCSSIEG
jgi:glycosyltransferase involved in cell wall biosynthesis